MVFCLVALNLAVVVGQICSPEVITFSESVNSDDFESLLNGIKCPRTNLQLVEGNFKLKYSTLINLNQVASEKLVIEGILCEAGVTTNCYPVGTRPIILLQNVAVQILIEAPTILRNLKFSHQFPFKSGCESCTYCPLVTHKGSDVINDRGEVLESSQYLESSYCEDFNKIYFLVSQVSIELENVAFSDFRMGYSGILSIELGKATFKKVDFSNIIVKESVISSDKSLIDSFVYEEGNVELLNNGFEIDTNLLLGNFMYLKVIDLTIKNLEVKKNIYSGYSNFIQLYDIKNLLIEDCKFSLNVLNGNLIEVSQESLKSNYDDNNLSFFIRNSIFSESIATNFIEIGYYTIFQTVFIENCKFTDSIFNAAISAISDFDEFNQNSDNFLNFKLSNLEFLRNYSPFQISISKLKQVMLSGITIKDNSIKNDIAIDIMNEIMKDERIYFKIIYNPKLESSSVFLLNFENIGLLYIEDLRLSNNYGPVLKADTVSVMNITTLISLSNSASNYHLFYFYILYECLLDNLILLNNSMTNEKYYLMSIQTKSGAIQMNIMNSLINDSYGSIRVASCNSINIDNFTINNSSSQLNSILTLNFIDISSFSLKNSIFFNISDDIVSLGSSISTIKVDILIENITIKHSKGSLGMIQFENSLFLSEYRNSFIRNSRFEGISGIIISILSSKGNIQIFNCQFSENVGSSPNIYIVSSSNVTIKNSKFLNSLASSISFQKKSDYNTLITNNCLFSNISNTIISISLSDYTDFGSTFEFNKRLLISGSVGAVLKLISSYIIRNSNPFDSLLYCIYYSHVRLFDVIFDSNESLHKSIIFLENQSSLQMNNTLFLNNTGFRGSVLFIQHSSSFLSKINYSTFKFNRAFEINTIFLLESNLSIDHSDFIENTSNGSAGIHVTYESSLKLNNSRFIGHVGLFSCIRAEDSSEVEVFHSQFLNSSEKTSGSLIKTSESSFKCLGCKFSTISYGSGNLIYSLSSILEFIHMDVIDVKFGKSSSLIYLSFNSECFGHRVNVQNFSGIAFKSDNNSTIVLNDSVIRCMDYLDGISEAGTGIYCYGCLKVNLNLVIFESLKAETDGGCLYSHQDRYGKINYINSSSFNSCVGQNGGSLMLKDSSYNIDNSNFTSNRAISEKSQGGAIYQLTLDISSSLNISSSNFIKNSASQSGGAIQWYSLKPRLNSLIFSSNKAYYGPNIGSFTESLQLESSSRSLSSQIFPPGEPSPSPLKISLKDHYNQTVLTDNSTKLLLYSENSFFKIEGQYISKASEGLVEFPEIKIFGAPKSESQILIKIESNDNQNTSVLEIPILLRDCIAGEQFVQENHCQKCEDKFYSLKPGKRCLDCPDGAECHGKDLIYAKPGYWRRNNRTDQIFKCFNKKACLGDYNSTKCEKGYKGNLCQVCSQGFSISQGNECSECLEKDVNVGRIVSILILVAGFLAFQSWFTLQSVYKERSVTSIYLKIIINYLQLVSLTIGFELDWPRLVKELFKVQKKASSSSDEFISFDCFLSEYFNPFFSKVLIISLTPVICFICSMIFWLLWKKLKHSEKVMEKFIGTVIVQLFFFYPSVIRLNFLTFFCTEMEKDDFYLTSCMNIKCWESTHLIFTHTVALPSIITFCIGFPLSLLFTLRKNSKNLQDDRQKLKYGFLYNGFSDEFYYWEFLIILRKLLIIIFFVFLSKISIPIQALCTFIVILISFLLQLRFQPYINDQLNTLELMSIVVSAVTIYSGIFFLTGDLSEDAKIIVFVVMVLSNFIFLSYWTYLTFSFFFAKLYLKARICRRVFRGKFDVWAQKIHPVTQVDDKKEESAEIYLEKKSCFKDASEMNISVMSIN